VANLTLKSMGMFVFVSFMFAVRSSRCLENSFWEGWSYDLGLTKQLLVNCYNQVKVPRRGSDRVLAEK